MYDKMLSVITIKKMIVLIVFSCLVILTNCNIINNHNSNVGNNIKRSINEESNEQENFVIDANPAPGSPFHLAIPVHSMEKARDFYGRVLGLKEGRRSDNKWQVLLNTANESSS